MLQVIQDLKTSSLVVLHSSHLIAISVATYQQFKFTMVVDAAVQDFTSVFSNPNEEIYSHVLTNPSPHGPARHFYQPSVPPTSSV